MIRTLETHTEPVWAVAATTDGRHAISGSYDRTLRLWDLESGQTIRTLEGHTDAVYAVVVTLDGRCAVSASHDKTLRVWDVESGQMLRPLEGHTDPVNAMAVTPDGRRALSASWDKTLRVWDLESGKEIASFTGDYRMLSCAIVPNGPAIVAGDESGQVHFLEIVEADPTKPAIGETKIQLLAQPQSTDKPDKPAMPSETGSFL
jgi:WD40 repeat protein